MSEHSTPRFVEFAADAPVAQGAAPAPPAADAFCVKPRPEAETAGGVSSGAPPKDLYQTVPDFSTPSHPPPQAYAREPASRPNYLKQSDSAWSVFGRIIAARARQLLESVAYWVMSRDVLVMMIPTLEHAGMLHPSNIRLRRTA
jgi:hypothetical protein